MKSAAQQSVELLTLDNGLRVALYRDERLHRAAVAVLVGVGVVDESPENNGISHFLEHMLYRGTANHPSAHAQNLAFESLGGSLEAATSTEETMLRLSMPRDSVVGSLQLLGDLLERPAFGQIEVERGIVREEILEDLDDRGRDINVDNLVRSLAFRGSSLALPITGPAKNLESFDESTLRAHFGQYFRPSNMALALAGNYSPSDVNKVLTSHFAVLKEPAQPLSRNPPFVHAQRGFRRGHRNDEGSQTTVRLSFLGPGRNAPVETRSLELLLRVLDDGMSSRLYRALCDEGGLVYDCFANVEAFPEVSIFDVGAEVTHSRLVEVVTQLTRLVAELAESGPTEDELERAKQRHRWSVDAMRDDATELASGLCAALFFRRDPSFEALERRYEAISRAEVQSVSRALFRRTNATLASVGKLESGVAEGLRAALRTLPR